MCVIAGTSARSAELDAAEAEGTAGQAQHEKSATAVESAVHETDAMLTSAPAAAELATSPPLKGATAEPTSGGTSKPSAGAAKPSPPAKVVASQAADASNASAYAATALAPQPSVLEPLSDADATQLQEEGKPPAADDHAHVKQGIMGTVSRLKALFEKQKIDRQVVQEMLFIRSLTNARPSCKHVGRAGHVCTLLCPEIRPDGVKL